MVIILIGKSCMKEKQEACFLPTYPFALERYWIAEKTLPSQRNSDKQPEAMDIYYYHSVWKEIAITKPAIRPVIQPDDQALLVNAPERVIHGTAKVFCQAILFPSYQ